MSAAMLLTRRKANLLLLPNALLVILNLLRPILLRVILSDHIVKSQDQMIQVPATLIPTLLTANNHVHHLQASSLNAIANLQ